MKVLTLKTTIGLLLIALFVACASKHTLTLPPSAISNPPVDFDLDFVRGNGLEPVSFKYANSLYDNYRDEVKHKIERNWVSLNRKIPKANMQTRYAWVSYADLKAFVKSLEEIEDQIKKNPSKYKDLSVSGVRIYFGVYPKEEPEVEQSKNKLTLILCGTYYDKCSHIDIINKQKDKILSITADYENHGHLCPPQICPGALLDEQ